ncbi:MAG: class I SAM-dependent methyltransferase [Proteobacteria bacterium]|nr:class I SAM-dependent methyltransferase [Pseudomonadota bacterium]
MQALLDTIATMPLPTDAQRIFHGRGGLHPGCEQWALDAYPPLWLLTSFAPVAEEQVAAVHQALAARWAHIAPGQPLHWALQTRGQAGSDTRLIAGEVPEPHTVTEAGARFRVHLMRGQNHGLFLDMAEGRRWVREHLAARCASASCGEGAGRRAPRVLNLFAYTCAFSIAALQGGAGHVVNIDMARGALTIGQQNHQLNGFSGGASFWAHDIFSSWGKISRAGPYDLVIADPPSYQKGSFVAQKDYARLLRRLPDLLAPGGHALLCLNAPELGPDFLVDQAAEHAPDLRFVERVANPAVFADVDEGRGLKVMVFGLG